MSGRRSIPSPCVAVCVLDRERGHCTGCYRTMDEIARWTVMSPEEKEACLERLEERRAADPINARLHHRRKLGPPGA